MTEPFVYLSDLPAVPLRRRRSSARVTQPSQADSCHGDGPPVPSFLDTARLDEARERLRRAIPPLEHE